MLKHLSSPPVKPKHVAVLGAGGFIGSALCRHLAEGAVSFAPIGRRDIDLLLPEAVDLLAAEILRADALVVISAEAPCKTPEMLTHNILMMQHVCAAIEIQQPAHLVYVSSDAVYADSDQPLNEESCAQPASLHGVMHLAREIMIRQSFAGPLAILRPTLVYGEDDPHDGYGPNRFRRLAEKGEDIVLFGEGEERRDHVLVDDVATLLHLILTHRSDGVLNATTGEVTSFLDVARMVTSHFDAPVMIKGSPRVGPMPHNGYRAFDISAIHAAFPGFSPVPIAAGLRLTHLKSQRAPAKHER